MSGSEGEMARQIDITRKAKPRREHTDWEALRRDFILNDGTPLARTWLRDQHGWDDEKLSTGNTIEHISGWGKERANFQQLITQEATEAARQAENERYPELVKAKLNIVAKLIADVSQQSRWDQLSTADKQRIYEIVKTELGEPTRITKSDIKGDLTTALVEFVGNEPGQDTDS